jgi:CDP-glucose 4,6-dehydratase
MNWNGTRVLLTGHTGFKGAWLTLWLSRLGCRVTGLALPPPSTPSLFDVAEVADACDSLIGDIRDMDRVRRAFDRGRPDVVFHLAAQSLVRESYREPIHTFATNVMGTAHVLEAVRHAPSVRAVVVVTSDKCYENQEWLWPYRESDPLGGHDPYSASKGAAEIVTSSFARSFFSGGPSSHAAIVASVRAGNVIGGGDWSSDRLVPDIVRAFTTGESVVVRNPQAVRPWQHVLDALQGYLTLAERLCDHGHAYAGAWNFGPADSDARPVSWVVDEMVRRWGPPAAWVDGSGPAVHEATLLRLDSSKARSRLGWSPKLDLPTALDWTVDWYRAHRDGDDMHRVTLRQVEQFLAV